MSKDNVALLISSYDGAEDLWEPLEKTYIKFWGDIPFKVYLITNTKTYSSKLFNVIQVGKEKSWSDSIIKALSLIPEKRIILTFDDLFLYQKIETEKVTESIQYAIQNNLSYFQLFPSTSIYDLDNNGYRKKRENARYRNATVWSLWQTNILLELLDEHESAWEFEKNGNERSRKFQDFFSTDKILIPYLNGVIKGNWDPKVVKFLHSINISIDTKARSELKGLDLVKYRLKQFKFFIYRYINKI
jgi:hypothetical protein